MHFNPSSTTSIGTNGKRCCTKKIIGRLCSKSRTKTFFQHSQTNKRSRHETNPAIFDHIKPFSRLDYKNPYNHLSTFYKLIGTMELPCDDEEAIYPILFRFSLTERAETQLQSNPSQNLSRWENVEKKFLTRICPPPLPI